ncbi:MAG: PAS domain-containing protein [Nitrospirae bacterium]|nr:PAS domain-containing protein [Nitrospirota bacterium]
MRDDKKGRIKSAMMKKQQDNTWVSGAGLAGGVGIEQDTLFSILDNLPVFVYLQDRDYSLRFANKRFNERFGDHRGRRCYEIYHKTKEPCRRCTTSRIFETGVPQKREWRSIDGHVYQIHDYPFTDAYGNELALKMGIDITERKRKEEQEVRDRNHESISILAGGIAHDFNNILTSILGNISVVKTIAEEGDRIFEILTDAEMASLRARDLTSQLVTFAKGKRSVRTATSISRLIRESAEEALRRPDLKYELDLSKGLWPVEVDEDQMRQVFSGIICSAREAIQAGGTIGITAENMVVHDEHFIPLNTGKYVKLSFRDNGRGTAKEETQRKAALYFSPWNSGAGAGMGLCMALCHSIVKNHGGHMSVESSRERGPVFSLYLPALT